MAGGAVAGGAGGAVLDAWSASAAVAGGAVAGGAEIDKNVANYYYYSSVFPIISH